MTPMLLVLLLVVVQDKPKPKELPVVKYSVPLAIEADGKAIVLLRGFQLDGVKSVTTAAKDVGLKILEAGKKANVQSNFVAEKIGDSTVAIEAQMPKKFTGDTLPIVVKDANGESLPYNLTVASLITKEAEPNDDFVKAQKLTLPNAIDGLLQKERDIDLFQLEGKKDQELSVVIHAAKLGSPADVMITLYDSKKQVLQIVDDVAKSTDPSFTIKLPADGTYFLAVMEANDLGGGQFGYRLMIK